MSAYTDQSIAGGKRYESLQSILNDLSDMLLPPERISVSEAAAKYRKVYNPPVVNSLWDNSVAPYLEEVMNTLESRDYSQVCFVSAAQSLKALAIDTPIPVPAGWTTMGDLSIGDIVFDNFGQPCTVIGVTPVQLGKQCFRITFDDDTTIVTDADHRWYVETKDNRKFVTTTLAMSKDFNCPTKRANGRSRYSVPNARPLKTPARELPLDPYLLGLWLGDGSTYRAHITSGATDVDHYVREIERAGHRYSLKRNKTAWQIYLDPQIKPGDRKFCIRGHCLTTLGRTKKGYCAECARQQSMGFQYGTEVDPVIEPKTFGVHLADMGLFKNKHIPEEYLRASFEQRVALLQGLMDSDGTCSRRVSYSVFCTTKPGLLKGFRELLWSLGIKHTVRSHQPKKGKLAYSVSFTTYNDLVQVFRLPRKLEIFKGSDRKIRPGQTTRRWVRKIEPIESVPVRCIAVDSPDRLYLAGEQMVPTHNTEVIQNWAAYNVVCDPSDFLIVEKAQTEAKNFSMMKLDRTLRHSPALASRLIQRRTANNVFDKRFKSGAFLNITWPTVNAASGKTIRRVALTDYDRMPQDLSGEGSPFDLFSQRPKVYKRLGMTYVESSPSFDVINHQWRPSSPHEAPPCEAGIMPIYNRGDRRRRYWQCPHCREWFEPSFGLLRWPDSKDHMECAEGVFMACPHCFDSTGAMILQYMRQELDTKGVWLKDGETIDRNGVISGKARRSDIASFWLKGPATAFGQWKTMVLKYLAAMEEYETTGNDRPLKTTVNTEQGEPYIPPSLRDARVPEDLMSRAEDLGDRVVPHGVRFLIATIDVQKHRFVVQVHGVKPANRTVDLVVVDRFDILKSERLDEDGERFLVNPAAYPEDWDLITSRVIERTYELADRSGRHMAIRLVGCDSGGRVGVTSRAYEYYRRLKTQGHAGRFFLFKGGSNYSAPRVQKVYPDSERKDRNAGARGEIPILLLNTDLLKDWVDSTLGRETPGAGYIQFADWLPLDFYKELCVETRNAKGRWENLKKLRNESWDLLAYCYALCIYLRAEKIEWEKPSVAWAKEWDENVLVYAPNGTALVKHESQDDLAEKLRKLAQQVG